MIPPEVFAIRIIAIGAQGGPVASCNGGPCTLEDGTAVVGGFPGQVIVEVGVSPGDVFEAYLGQQGGQDTTEAGAGGQTITGGLLELDSNGGDSSVIGCAAFTGGSQGAGGKT